MFKCAWLLHSVLPAASNLHEEGWIIMLQHAEREHSHYNTNTGFPNPNFFCLLHLTFHISRTLRKLNLVVVVNIADLSESLLIRFTA